MGGGGGRKQLKCQSGLLFRGTYSAARSIGRLRQKGNNHEEKATHEEISLRLLLYVSSCVRIDEFSKEIGKSLAELGIKWMKLGVF